MAKKDAEKDVTLRSPLDLVEMPGKVVLVYLTEYTMGNVILLELIPRFI